MIDAIRIATTILGTAALVLVSGSIIAGIIAAFVLDHRWKRDRPW